MFKNLKQYLSLNILAFAAYPVLLSFFKTYKYIFEGGIIPGFINFIIAVYYLLIIITTILMFFVESIFHLKISSAKILQNKIYTICFNIGLLISISFISVSIIIISLSAIKELYGS